jgi:CheY-like chemotaxis protein
MTAHAFKGDQERCLAIGMDAYISKPIRQQELYVTLENILSHKGMTAQELDSAVRDELVTRE